MSICQGIVRGAFIILYISTLQFNQMFKKSVLRIDLFLLIRMKLLTI